MTVKDGDTIAVWFSCGAASATAAIRTVIKYGHRCNVRVVNNPVFEEHHDNYRFLHDIELLLGQQIEIALNDHFPTCSAEVVWEQRAFMSAPHGAPCTYELKKKARQAWEARNTADWHVLGFTADERKRHDNFVMFERDNVIPVLIDDGLTKQDCYNEMRFYGVRLPEMYALGYPNANCIGCVKATSPTYWNHVRKQHPEVFARRAQQSRRIGARLARYKNERVFLDELPADAKGRPMKNLDFECGIFCEEKP